MEEVAKAVIKKEEISKKELWLYAILPIIILSLAAIALLYYIIRTIRKYRKVSIKVIVAGVSLAILLIPFTDEILYWAILPMSIIVLVIGIGLFVVWKLVKRKFRYGRGKILDRRVYIL